MSQSMKGGVKPQRMLGAAALSERDQKKLIRKSHPGFSLGATWPHRSHIPR
jgi:hypothetical protein